MEGERTPGVYNEATFAIKVDSMPGLKAASRVRTASARRSPLEPKLARPAAVTLDALATQADPDNIRYIGIADLDNFVTIVAMATPMQLVMAEREGVAGRFFKDVSKRMGIPAARVFTMVGVPKATAEKKIAAGQAIKGTPGRSALGLARLLAIAKDIVANSTAAEARNFDSAKWLGLWIERPQPALGGRKPADLLDTSAGVDLVARLLGSIESGAYQ